MVEVKDKLITAESLKAAYDANKQAISQLYEETAGLKSDMTDLQTALIGVDTLSDEIAEVVGV